MMAIKIGTLVLDVTDIKRIDATDIAFWKIHMCDGSVYKTYVHGNYYVKHELLAKIERLINGSDMISNTFQLSNSVIEIYEKSDHTYSLLNEHDTINVLRGNIVSLEDNILKIKLSNGGDVELPSFVKNKYTILNAKIIV